MESNICNMRAISPQNNAAKLVNSDPELCIFSQQDHEVDPPHPPVNPPASDPHLKY